MFERLVRDLRYAGRVLRNAPGFTATAIITLALAIGINTAVFSMVHGVLLRPLPYPAPERLGLLEATVVANGLRATRTSQHGVAWTTIRDHATTVDRAVFSTWASGVNVMAGDRAIHAQQQRVSAGFFGVLGLAPLQGREFTTAEDTRGGPAAVIISDRFWRGVLGADPHVVGGALSLRGEAHTVVGIMPADAETGVRADLWTPLRPSTEGEGGGENYQVLLRLRPGATWAMADAELARLGPEINRLRPPAEGTTITYGTTPLDRGLTASTRRPLLILWAAVGLVLLIACINLSGLLYARTARRSREIATRLALGSGRAAIVRQLLMESIVIAVAGAAAGIVLAALALASLRGLAEETLDLWRPITLDGVAIALAAILALVATALAGLLPAMQSTRLGARYGLMASGMRTASGSSRQFSRVSSSSRRSHSASSCSSERHCSCARSPTCAVWIPASTARTCMPQPSRFRTRATTQLAMSFGWPRQPSTACRPRLASRQPPSHSACPTSGSSLLVFATSMGPRRQVTRG